MTYKIREPSCTAMVQSHEFLILLDGFLYLDFDRYFCVRSLFFPQGSILYFLSVLTDF